MTTQNDSGKNLDLKAVIFDLGGVILRTDDYAPRSELAAQVGKTYNELDELVFGSPIARQAEEGLTTPDEVWEFIRAEIGLTREALPGFRQSFFGGDQVDYDLVGLIRALHPSYTTTMLSNTNVVDLAHFLQDELHIPPDTFDVIISSAEVGMVKPNPAIFHLALERSGASAQQAVFVDDNAANIAAAQALGIHTIHFRSTPQARAELLALVTLPDRSQ